MSPDRMETADPFSQVPTGHSLMGSRTGPAVLGVFAVFLAWAVFVPLDSAVIAPGHLMSAGRNQTLQHPTGGTIHAIRAREGDAVRKGDVLLELEPQVDLARLTKLRAREAALAAIETRLQAEKSLNGAAPPPFVLAGLDLRGSETQLRRGDAPVGPGSIERRLAREQEREFQRGRQAVAAQVATLAKRSEADLQRRAGLGEQIEAARALLAILEQKAGNMRRLETSGYVSRRQLWDAEGQILEQRSLLARLVSDSAALDRSVEETAAEIERVRTSDARETSQRLTDVMQERDSIRFEIAAAEQALRQTKLVAPASGRLVHFTANTPGAVIRAGETLGEIVPEGARLVARARVSPEDIVAVHAGQTAEIHVSALPSRTTDPLQGNVTFVASDATVEERSGARYFEIEARVDLTGRDDLRDTLSSGMSAQVFVKGRPRTFASYVVQPLTEALGHTFRER